MASTACGEVLRDSLGNFVFALCEMLGRCFVVQDELCAIFHGLRIIKERGISDPILIESDFATVVKFLNEGCPRENSCCSLVNHVVYMAGDNDSVKCVHIFKEANQVAYRFAKQGLSILGMVGTKKEIIDQSCVENFSKSPLSRPVWSIGDVYMKHAQFNREPLNPKFRLLEPMNVPILSANPTIISHALQPNDSFLIFASDGLWEHLTNEKAVDIVNSNPHAYGVEPNYYYMVCMLGELNRDF
ncbi:probable protein phosphatase 2C 25 [Abrus precatorius]|uniref:Probable protein phosphatase 2C 25 n=1 Tax=Abrus precatorius TaxID=3816 RepID=A0A8B8M1B3_ABRPR|nr:probable protein phosphatase 2C 25 [Abrus precatorius]